MNLIFLKLLIWVMMNLIFVFWKKLQLLVVQPMRLQKFKKYVILKLQKTAVEGLSADAARAGAPVRVRARDRPTAMSFRFILKSSSKQSELRRKAACVSDGNRGVKGPAGAARMGGRRDYSLSRMGRSSLGSLRQFFT